MLSTTPLSDLHIADMAIYRVIKTIFWQIAINCLEEGTQLSNWIVDETGAKS